MHVLTVEDERGSKEMEWYQIRTAEDGEKKGAAATEGELGGGTKKVVAGLARRAGGRGRCGGSATMRKLPPAPCIAR